MIKKEYFIVLILLIALSSLLYFFIFSKEESLEKNLEKVAAPHKLVSKKTLTNEDLAYNNQTRLEAIIKSGRRSGVIYELKDTDSTALIIISEYDSLASAAAYMPRLEKVGKEIKELSKAIFIDKTVQKNTGYTSGIYFQTKNKIVFVAILSKEDSLEEKTVSFGKKIESII